jgi:hypothetical protein
MEETEITTKSDESVSQINPTTPTPSSGSWWGGWISQAKEKVL